MVRTKNLPGRIAVLIFFIILSGIIVYKGIYVPITHDEKSASVHYPTFSVWQIMMYPDCWPSNHILNSLSIKLSESIFGIEPWSVRLPNMLAFLFFFSVMYSIAVRYFNDSSFLFCLPFAVVFCNPFLLDFFGLARGYGMSNALMAGSVYCILRYASTLHLRWYFFAIILSMLAAYANFTLLIYWVGLHATLMLMLILSYDKNKLPVSRIIYVLVFTALLAIGFLALCYQPLNKMQSTNQFVYWAKTSFFTDTILDQVNRFRYGVRYFGIPASYVAYVLIALLTGIGIYIIWKIRKLKWTAVNDPLVVLFTLLMLVWGVNMTQTIILGTPYLSGRTALSYYVLFSLMLIFLIRDMSLGVNWVRRVMVPLIVAMYCIHLCFAVNLRSVNEWWYDANTYQVMDYLQHYQKEHPDKKIIELNTNWLFNPSFGFYTSAGKVPWLRLTEIHTNIDTTSNTLFYYATNDDAVLLREYRTVMDFDYGTRRLMIRK